MLPIILFVVVSFRVVSGATPRYDYCKFYPFHTMCQMFRDNKTVDCLGNEFDDGLDHYVPEGRLSKKEKDEILVAHNKLREKVANGYLYSEKHPYLYLPKSRAMYEMLWDDELEELAQAHADRCQNVMFDVNRDVKRFLVGQNIYHSCSTNGSNNKFDANELIETWAETRYHINMPRFYGFSPRLEYFSDMRLATFAQMVWGIVCHLGCARAVFKGMKQVPGTNEKVEVWINQYVCNYGPSGLEMRLPIYRLGRTASDCCNPKKRQKYAALCVLCEPGEDGNWANNPY